MGTKKEQPKQTIEQLLEKERTKNRRIVTTTLIAVALVAGFIGGFFVSMDVITDQQAKAVSVVTESKSNQ